MKEQWKNIKGFKGLYKISNLGYIKSLDRTVMGRNKSKRIIKGKLLHPIVNTRGYLKVELSKENKRYTRTVHRLVAKTFIENSDKSLVTNHKDCNKLNNNVNNLEWCTQKENVLHSIKNGHWGDVRGEKHGQSVLKNKDVLKIRKMWKSGKYYIREIADEFDVKESQIRPIIYRYSWKHI